MTEAKSFPSSAVVATLPSVRAAEKSAARCACGHAIHHPNVLPEPFYSHGSWLLFLIGVTAKPAAVLYRCLWCKQILGKTRDPQVMARFD